MAFSLIKDDAGAVPLTVIDKAQLPQWRESAPRHERDWAQAFVVISAVQLRNG